MKNTIAVAVSALALAGCVTAEAAASDPAGAQAVRCLAVVEVRIDRMMQDSGNVPYPAWQARDHWLRQVHRHGLEQSPAVHAEAAALLRDRPQAFDAELARCYAAT